MAFRLGRTVQLVVAVAILAASAGLVYLMSRGETSRSSSQPSAVPTDAEAGFVGSARCAECHPGNAEKHARSGHANTFAAADASPLADWLAGRRFRDPVREVTFTYGRDEQGLYVRLPERFESVFPLEYAFGSGTQAVTFLSVIPSIQSGTVGIEHRASWFAHNDALALTPGQRGLQPTKDVEHFGRVIRGRDLERCVGCHTTRAEIRDGRLTDVVPNVGCESCHGPGAEHVAAVQEGRDDLQIRFAADTWEPIDQIRLCGECHRFADDETENSIHPNDHKLVRFQPVGLVRSPCFQQSGGALSCSTCHDPHETATARTTEEYGANCLDCHAADASAAHCPVNAESGCIECHMPPVEVHPGITFHDHWIRVREAGDLPAADATGGDAAHPAVAPRP